MECFSLLSFCFSGMPMTMPSYPMGKWEGSLYRQEFNLLCPVGDIFSRHNFLIFMLLCPLRSGTPMPSFGATPMMPTMPGNPPTLHFIQMTHLTLLECKVVLDKCIWLAVISDKKQFLIVQPYLLGKQIQNLKHKCPITFLAAKWTILTDHPKIKIIWGLGKQPKKNPIKQLHTDRPV